MRHNVAPAREAMDVTVRLFSTAPLRSVELTPESTGVRWCADCGSHVAGKPVVVRAGAAGRLEVDGRTAGPQLKFESEVSARTPDGRAAAVAGRWTIVARADGLHVLVQVPSERYVMAVLAGEAAPDEPAESLKALAVVTRSFAMLNPQRHGAEGLCDSTHCQALRLGPVREVVRAAVEATSGETLWFGGEGAEHSGHDEGARQVSGYFTENCGGMSGDAAVLWGGAREPWLSVHPDPYCVRSPALWHAELRLEQVRSALAGEGLAIPPIIERVSVVGRDASGRAAVLAFAGDGGKVTKVAAASVRFALDRAYGWNQLRSDLYRVSVVDGRVLFDGRGYGHGVGLCQAGARAMAMQGKSYRDILRFYFPGTSVRVLAGDDGWTMRQEQGWTLRAVSGRDAAAALEAEGNAAWTQARSAVPGARGAVPQVTVYPTTELFRQAMGAPGWELAATRGKVVALQPLAVVVRAAARDGRADARGWAIEDVLRHEFLHVLVESESQPKAPLWLREGLVEVMAGERCETARLGAATAERHPGTGLPEASRVEASLRAANSWAESQRAHAAACRLVRREVERYGAGAVRGWLRDGVPAGVLADQ